MKTSHAKTGLENRFFCAPVFSMNRLLPQSGTNGFTLIEMMIVIAMIAILAGIAVPNLTTMLPRFRTKAAARELKNDIQKAKLEAIKQNKECLVVFEPGSGTNGGSCVACISSDNDCTDTDDQIVFKLSFDDHKSAALSDTTFSSNKFIFNTRGIPESTSGAMGAGTAVVQNKEDTNYYFKVIVASSGRVRIE